MENAPAGSVPHKTVLLRETVEHLKLRPGACVVDCTVGGGGHSAAILERIKPNGRLICLDVDPDALALARARLEPLAKDAGVTLQFVQSNFSRIVNVLKEMNAPPPDGIVADLGVSSMQFDCAERGFSFRFDAPLDMRMDPTLDRTAADILQQSSEEEIANILFELGEEHKSRRIARAIVEQRRTQPVRTTGELEELVRRALKIRGHRHIHPATKTFQALRLAVNEELERLQVFLEDAPDTLSEHGVLAIITFHSLEDRLVKHRYKDLSATGRFQQTVKFVAPGEDEVRENPRSRSAKLRVIQRGEKPDQ